MSRDALVCLQELLVNVPTWLSELDSILNTAVQRQKDLFGIDISQDAILQQSHTEHHSGHSGHSNEDVFDAQSPARDILKYVQRKKKSASLCTNHSSPANYRSRSITMLHYDGDVQRQFESIVRGIGTNRNALRKGKLSLKIDSLSRADSSSSSSSSAGEETIKGLGTFTYRTTTKLRRSNKNKKDGTELFENIDGYLEKAQLSCERAAHQILRDGDCSPQVSKANEHFQATVRAIEVELPSMMQKADKIMRMEAERSGSSSFISAEVSSVMYRSSLPNDAMLEVDPDELSNEEESDFDITTVKLPPKVNKYSRSQRCADVPIRAVT